MSILGKVSPLDADTVFDLTAAAATASYSATGATTLFTCDTTGYQAISVQVTSAGTSCTITYEVSNDNSTWVSKVGYDSTNTGSAASASTSTTAVILSFQVPCRYFRARVSTFGSGTVTVVPVLRSTPLPPLGVNIGNTSLPVGSTSVTGGIASTSRLLSAANTTNSTLVKAGAGRLYGIQGYNAAGALRYLKLYNKVTAPTVGTDTPVKTLTLPATAVFLYEWPLGYSFATGIGYGLTTAAADADTGALTAADIATLNIDYT